MSDEGTTGRPATGPACNDAVPAATANVTDRRAGPVRLDLATRGGTSGPLAPVATCRHVFRPRAAAGLLFGLAILYAVYRRGFGLEWRELSTQVAGANGAFLALAFAVFYTSFLVRGLRWQALLRNVGYGGDAGRPMPSLFGLVRIMYLAWFANCVAVARLGDAYRAYLLKKWSAHISFTVTLGTVLAERLLDLVVLAAMLGATVAVAFHGALPREVVVALVAALALSASGMLGLLSMSRLRERARRILPPRLHGYYASFERGTVGSLRRIPLLVAYSVAGWTIEGATLYTVAAAVGAPVSFAGALMVGLIASLLTTIPITPSGLGLTEAGMVLALQWLGLDAGTAGAGALLTRAINYWSIVLFGFVLYVFRIDGPEKRQAKQPLGEERQGGS